MTHEALLEPAARSGPNQVVDFIYRHILIPTDGSKLSGKAVEEGLRLASALGSSVTFFIAAAPFASIGDLDHAFAGAPEAVRQQARNYLETEAREALRSAASVAAARGVSADSLIVESDQLHEAIIAAAKAKGADLIVMASHGRHGAKAILLGSVAHKVLTHTNLPVLICR